GWLNRLPLELLRPATLGSSNGPFFFLKPRAARKLLDSVVVCQGDSDRIEGVLPVVAAVLQGGMLHGFRRNLMSFDQMLIQLPFPAQDRGVNPLSDEDAAWATF